MFRAIVLVGLMLVAAPGAAKAYDGNSLLKACEKRDEASGIQWGLCMGYVSAVVDMAIDLQAGEFIPKTLCLPEKFDPDQMRDITIKALRENPENRHYHAATFVFKAIRDAFPCK